MYPSPGSRPISQFPKCKIPIFFPKLSNQTAKKSQAKF